MSLSFSLQVSFSLCLFVSLLLYALRLPLSHSNDLPCQSHSNDLPCQSYRKPRTLQDRLGPPCKITSPALQDRLTKATASLESWIWVGGFWIWVGGFFKIRSRLWVLNWFYGRGYVLIEGFGLWVWVDWFGSWLLWVVPWVEAVWWVVSFFFFFNAIECHGYRWKAQAMAVGETSRPSWERWRYSRRER